MAAQPTWYFIQVESARYSLTMTELLEANERSQTEQGRPDSKKQGQKMQIGIDSFAAQFADKGEIVNASASKSVGQLVERIEFAVEHERLFAQEKFLAEILLQTANYGIRRPQLVLYRVANLLKDIIR